MYFHRKNPHRVRGFFSGPRVLVPSDQTRPSRGRNLETRLHIQHIGGFVPKQMKKKTVRELQKRLRGFLNFRLKR